MGNSKFQNNSKFQKTMIYQRRQDTVQQVVGKHMMKLLCTTLIFGTLFVFYHAGTVTSCRRLLPFDFIGMNVFTWATDDDGVKWLFLGHVQKLSDELVRNSKWAKIPYGYVHVTFSKDVPQNGLAESINQAADPEKFLAEDTVREIAKKIAPGDEEHSQEVIWKMAQCIFDNHGYRPVDDYAKEHAIEKLRDEFKSILSCD